MVSINSQILLSGKHKDSCPYIKGRRLYIRDYKYKKGDNRNRKQVFIPWGLTCLTCTFVIRTPTRVSHVTKQELKRDLESLVGPKPNRAQRRREARQFGKGYGYEIKG